MKLGHSRGHYPVDRELQDEFCEGLKDMGFESDGYMREEKLRAFEKSWVGEMEEETLEGFENNTFRLFPYYWGEDDVLKEMPNFLYKPTGLEISWYKYPLRDAFSNHYLSAELLRTVMEDCLLSVTGEADIDERLKEVEANIEKAEEELRQWEQQKKKWEQFKDKLLQLKK